MNYEQAMEYIHAVQWAGHKPGLTRTRTLLAALGDPHKQLRFVHRRHDGILPAGRGLSGGPVHLALHQPLQRAHPGQRRADPG